MPRNCDPEAEVERRILRSVGRSPGVLLLKNEVGQGYAASVRWALQQALKFYGPAVIASAEAALLRHRLTWGLGVGSPDLVGAVDGRAFCLEVKAEDGVVAPHQETWHAAARRLGVHVEVARSEDEAAAAIARCRGSK